MPRQNLQEPPEKIAKEKTLARIRDTSAQDLSRPPPRYAGLRRWLVPVLLIAFAGFAIAAYPTYSRWGTATQSVSKERLRIATVSRRTLIRDVTAQGSVIAAIKPTLFSPAAGVVALKVQAGDPVTAGELIASIDSPELENQLDQEESALQSAATELNRIQIEAKKADLGQQQLIDLAEVALTAARRELRRAEAAQSSGAISEFDFDKARDDLAKAELKHRHAQQDGELQKESLQFEIRTRELAVERQKLAVDELQRQVEELSIRSPVNGIVGNLAVSDHDAIDVNQPLVTVVDLSAFEVELQVPDQYANTMAIGLDAEISHGGQRYPGTVIAISPEVKNSQITTKVRFTGETPPNLKQNQRVAARILLETRDDVLMVDRGPFLDSGGGRYVFRLEDNLARRLPVELGTTTLAGVEILSGIEEGDNIIISSTRDFEDAETVYLVN